MDLTYEWDQKIEVVYFPYINFNDIHALSSGIKETLSEERFIPVAETIEEEFSNWLEQNTDIPRCERERKVVGLFMQPEFKSLREYRTFWPYLYSYIFIPVLDPKTGEENKVKDAIQEGINNIENNLFDISEESIFRLINYLDFQYSLGKLRILLQKALLLPGNHGVIQEMIFEGVPLLCQLKDAATTNIIQNRFEDDLAVPEQVQKEIEQRLGVYFPWHMIGSVKKMGNIFPANPGLVDEFLANPNKCPGMKKIFEEGSRILGVNFYEYIKGDLENKDMTFIAIAHVLFSYGLSQEWSANLKDDIKEVTFTSGGIFAALLFEGVISLEDGLLFMKNLYDYLWPASKTIAEGENNVYSAFLKADANEDIINLVNMIIMLNKQKLDRVYIKEIRQYNLLVISGKKEQVEIVADIYANGGNSMYAGTYYIPVDVLGELMQQDPRHQVKHIYKDLALHITLLEQPTWIRDEIGKMKLNKPTHEIVGHDFKRLIARDAVDSSIISDFIASALFSTINTVETAENLVRDCDKIVTIGAPKWFLDEMFPEIIAHEIQAALVPSLSHEENLILEEKTGDFINYLVSERPVEFNLKDICAQFNLTEEEAIRVLQEIKYQLDEYLEVIREGQMHPIMKQRKQVHIDSDWHRTVHVILVNEKGELLVSVRGPKAHSSIGQKDVAAAAGHVAIGDGIATAMTEIEEELALTSDYLVDGLIRFGQKDAFKKEGNEEIIKDSYLADGTYSYKTEGNNREFSTLYVGIVKVSAEEISRRLAAKGDYREVSNVEFVDMYQAVLDMNESLSTYSSTFRQYFGHAELSEQLNLFIKEALIKNVLKDGPLTGKGLARKLGLRSIEEIFKLWQACELSEDIEMVDVGTRYLRLDKNIGARLSPSLGRRFFTYSIIGLKGDVRVKTRLDILRQYLSKINNEKLAIAMEMVKGIEGITKDFAVVIAGDITYGMGHRELRVDNQGEYVRGSDIDLIAVIEDDSLKGAIEKELMSKKIINLNKQLSEKEEMDFKVKTLSEIEDSLLRKEHEDLVAAKVLNEAILLSGSSIIYNKLL